MSFTTDPRFREHVETWKLRGDYQARGIDALFSANRGILVSGAGSGKTVMMARALEAVLRTDPLAVEKSIRLLWIANTQEQVEQAKRALAMAVGGNVMRRLFAPPTAVCCVAGAENLPLESYTHVIVDECHHAAAPSWAAVIRRCTGARIVWGCTATPHREDGNWPECEKLIGPIVARIDAAEVQQQGFTVSARVRFVAPCAEGELDEAVAAWVNSPEPGADKTRIEKAFAAEQWRIKRDKLDPAEVWKKLEARLAFQRAMAIGLADNPARNEAAARLCRQSEAAGHSTLCLVYSKEQGRQIVDQVPGARLVFSDMRVADGRREELIAAFRDGSLPVLVATSLADEGFDAPRASVLVHACGGRGISKAESATGEKKQTAKLEQRTARVLRCFDGKHEGQVIDFFDHQHSMLASSSWSRFRGYKLLGFQVEKCEEMQSRRIHSAQQPDMLKGVA